MLKGCRLSSILCAGTIITFDLVTKADVGDG